MRYFLGNLLGWLVYVFFGKKKMLNKIDESRILSIYFHNPSVVVFETIIMWLIKYEFNIISIKKLHEYFDLGMCSTKRTVFISFDDAWAGNLKLIPILKKYNIPVTLFVPVKAIEDGDIWINIVKSQFSKIDESLRRGLSVNDLKRIPYSHSQELYNSALKIRTVKRKIMTRQELLEFSKFAAIGSHTVSHPILTNCTSEIVRVELESSKCTLNNWGLSVNESLAYPNGSYNLNTINVLKKSNYKYAFTTKPQFIVTAEKENNYSLPRICIPDDFGKYENLARMSSAWSIIFKS